MLREICITKKKLYFAKYIIKNSHNLKSSKEFGDGNFAFFPVMIKLNLLFFFVSSQIINFIQLEQTQLTDCLNHFNALKYIAIVGIIVESIFLLIWSELNSKKTLKICSTASTIFSKHDNYFNIVFASL